MHCVARDVDLIEDLGYQKGILKFVAIIVFVQNWTINLDHGALPAAIDALMKDLKIEELQVGLMGSLLFFGLVIGSATATYVMGKCQYKYLLGAAMILNGCALLTLTLTDNFYILCAARLIGGFA